MDRTYDVCVHMCMQVNVHALVCASSCGVQRLFPGAIPSYFLSQGLSLAWSLLSRLDRLVNELKVIYLSLPSHVKLCLPSYMGSSHFTY